jgi:hypothetical protein
MKYAKNYTLEVTQGGKKVRHQAAMFPMFTLNLSQKEYEGTHAGTYAYDLTGENAGIDRLMAPFDLKIMAKDKVNGNFIIAQSINPVVCAHGYVGIVSMRVGPDNFFDDFSVGTVIKQGHAFYDEGVNGKATGNHIHLEVAQHAWDASAGMYDLNAQGTYHLRGNCPINDVFFLDASDKVKDNKSIPFKTYDNSKNYGATTSSKPNVTQGKKLYLPASADSWRVYPTSSKIVNGVVQGKESGKLSPSQFGGLTYDILGYPGTDFVTIQTRDFGKVNIYVAASTGAIIK